MYHDYKRYCKKCSQVMILKRVEDPKAHPFRSGRNLDMVDAYVCTSGICNVIEYLGEAEYGI